MVLTADEDVPLGNDEIDPVLLVIVRLPVAGRLVSVTLETDEIGSAVEEDEE